MTTVTVEVKIFPSGWKRTSLTAQKKGFKVNKPKSKYKTKLCSLLSDRICCSIRPLKHSTFTSLIVETLNIIFRLHNFIWKRHIDVCVTVAAVDARPVENLAHAHVSHAAVVLSRSGRPLRWWCPPSKAFLFDSWWTDSFARRPMQSKGAALHTQMQYSCLFFVALFHAALLRVVAVVILSFWDLCLG